LPVRSTRCPDQSRRRAMARIRTFALGTWRRTGFHEQPY
jgi:hypothetical protein